ncbi:hypothetical protein [Parasitella parasitica]|uniref:Uncharacterized protein n=1 Tax=Parasitella parasitica TaxID=35722 RepID=A0A0B7NUW6_9FUNG|nr:hypothetical protein [Parasitella parasitica]
MQILFGSDDDKEPFQDSLLELLMLKSQIDIKNTTYGLLGSVIRWDIVPGSVAWRAQYLLPEVYREIVAKQITIWLG